MDIKGFYLFKSDGLPLLSRYYGEDASIIDGLVAPFIITISQRFEEMTGAEMSEVKLGDDLYLLVEKFSDLVFAVIIKNKEGLDEDNLSLVMKRFYKRYYDVLHRKPFFINIAQFDEFTTELEKIMGIESHVVFKSLPSKPLDTFALTEFSGTTQKIIKKLIHLGQISIHSLQQELDLEDGELENGINELIESKYLGLKIDKGNKIIFKLM